jgi:3',5'-cyclic AMP phosphodiesterase CpdA
VEPSEVLLEPLVFVQFTDVHQSRGSGGDKGQYDNWYRSLVYVRDVIEPDFVIVTGDLTEGSGRFGAQVVEQWEDYRQAIDDAGFSRDNFHDVPGNHDARGPDRDFSFYQEYGVSGVPMHRWVQDQGPHRHLFLTLLTTEPGEDEGSLSGSTAIWAAQQLEAVEASHIFVFAHHNHWLLPFAAPDALVGSSGLLARHDVTAFVAGHRHVDWEHTRGGTRYVLTGNHYRGMPRSDAGWMRLFVVSGRQWATKTCYVVDHGPQVMIMSPQDERLVLPRSPGDNQSEGFITVEALAFGDDEPTLQVRLNGGPPQAMEVEGQLHRFSFDATGLPRGDHRLRVEAIPLVDEVTGADEVTFSVR